MLGKVITSNPWKNSARNTMEDGDREVDKNKASTAQINKFNPYTTSF